MNHSFSNGSDNVGNELESTQKAGRSIFCCVQLSKENLLWSHLGMCGAGYKCKEEMVVGSRRWCLVQVRGFMMMRVKMTMMMIGFHIHSIDSIIHSFDIPNRLLRPVIPHYSFLPLV